MSLPTISSIPLPDSRAGLTTAGAFLSAYNEASQLAMQREQLASDLQMREKQMQRQDQLMQWEGEDRQYRNDVLRPLEEQKMRLGNASEILGLQQQGADLRYREEMTRANSLRTGSNNAIYDSFNNDPRIQSGLEAGMRLFGGQGSEVPGDGSIGKATRYGYATDSTPDSNSRAGIGAWVSPQEQARIRAGENTPNRLRSGDLGFSPDVERSMRMAGIAPGQNVSIQYADGSEHTGRWMDKTATEYQGKKLTGRFDIYDPDGSYAERDGQPVVSFKRAGDDTAAPVGPSQVQTMRDAEAVLDAYEAGTEYVQRFTRLDSQGNPILDPRAQPIAEQTFAMETAIKASPMLSTLARQRAEGRQEAAAAKVLDQIFNFFQPGQFEDFKARQPGAFLILQRMDMGENLPLETKLQAVELLHAHASSYKPSANTAPPLPKEAVELISIIGRFQAMQPPQSRPDPANPKKMIEPSPEEIKEWKNSQMDFAGAKTALAAMALGNPSVAQVHRQLFTELPKAAGPKGPEGGKMTGENAAGGAPSPKSDDLPEELRGYNPTFFTPTPDREHAHAAAWTKEKNTVSAPFMEDGDQPSKDLLYAALLTAEGKKVNAGETTTVGIAGPGSGMGAGETFPVHSSPARALLLSKKLNPDEKIKVDGQSFTREEVLTERLTEIAKQRGYGKSQKGQEKEIHRGLTPEQARMLPSGSLVEDQNGVLRTVP